MALNVLIITIVQSRVRVHESHHLNHREMINREFYGNYMIDIPKPDKQGVSTLYLDTYFDEIVYGMIGLNNLTDSRSINNNLEGTAAKKIRVIIPNGGSLRIHEGIKVVGEKTDVELLGMEKFSCAACRFKNSDNVVIKMVKF